MPEFDWALGIGTLIVAFLGVLGGEAYRRGGKDKVDPNYAYLTSIADNTKRMDTLREAVSTIITTEHETVRKLEDILNVLNEINRHVEIALDRTRKG